MVQWHGSVVPDFANMVVSGVLEATLIFTNSPNHLMRTYNLSKNDGLAMNVKDQDKSSAFSL